MNITQFAQDLAKTTEDAKALAETTKGKSGADAHAAACTTDVGLAVLLLGADVNGRPIRKTAKSVAGAYFTMLAVAGLQRAWLVQSTGRKLLISRSAL